MLKSKKKLVALISAVLVLGLSFTFGVSAMTLSESTNNTKTSVLVPYKPQSGPVSTPKNIYF